MIIKFEPDRKHLETTIHSVVKLWGTRVYGVPLPFLAGERRYPSLHGDSYLQATEKCALNA